MTYYDLYEARTKMLGMYEEHLACAPGWGGPHSWPLALQYRLFALRVAIWAWEVQPVACPSKVSACADTSAESAPRTEEADAGRPTGPCGQD